MYLKDYKGKAGNYFMAIDFNKYRELLDRSYEKKLGKVVKVVGLTIHRARCQVK